MSLLCISIYDLYLHLTVYEELMTASRCRDYVILGVFMGREENLWRIASVRKRKKGFMAELEHRFVAKDPIYWKVGASACHHQRFM